MDQKKFELWYFEAENDFEIGSILFNAQKYNAAVFYFVQAAEKAVKALLYFKGIVSWGHSLIDLIISCEKVQINISDELKIIAQKLEKHYSSSRYPDALPDISPKDAYNDDIAEDIREKAMKILEFVKIEHEDLKKKSEENNIEEDLNGDAK